MTAKSALVAHRGLLLHQERTCKLADAPTKSFAGGAGLPRLIGEAYACHAGEVIDRVPILISLWQLVPDEQHQSPPSSHPGLGDIVEQWQKFSLYTTWYAYKEEEAARLAANLTS